MRHQAKFSADRSNRCGDMAVFQFFQDGGVRHLEFYKLKFLTYGPVQRADMHQCAKFCVDRLDLCGDMTVFRLFKMAAVRHLGFLKVRNVTYRSDSEGQYASPCQILCRSVELLRRYSQFSIFQDGGRPPCWICFTCIWTTHKEHLLVFVTVQNLAGIGAVVSIICQF